jgi:cellulose synthase/poly-beta-1,6-N-acetylglucosamine synthase-like glycosyltransferase
MAETLFWLAIFLIAYAYVGYPVLVFLISFFVKNEVKRADLEPSVTLLITAYNEEKNIREKIEDSLMLDYPWDRLEILVASDGSTDRTDEIVKEFSRQGVILCRVEGRVGKTETQNRAVQQARGEIVVFSDATTKYRRDAVRKIVRSYADPTVGAVSGRYEYVNPTKGSVGAGTKLFWRYENSIKRKQTEIKTITGCCGCIYSVRKALYEPLPADIISDLVEPLKILEKGYRIAFEYDAVAYEVTEEKAEEEFAMRVRVITRGMNGLAYVKGLLHPLRFPFVSFQLISHKVLRWMVPFFMLATLAANLQLLDIVFYRFTLLAQIGIYSAAFAGWVLDRLGRSTKMFFVPLYFFVVNLAAVWAAFHFLRGRRMVTWETVRK